MTVRLLPAIVLGGAIVWLGPRHAARLRFRSLVLACAASTALWSVALAVIDGVDALTAPLQGRHEHLPFARDVTSIGAFVDTFTERLSEYPIHVQGHPPATTVFFAALDRVGLGGSGWVAAVVVAGGAVAIAATVVLTRELAGERVARAAAPFLVTVPAAVWIASTADALYAGVGLGGVAMLAVAARRSGPSAAAGAVAGGAALGLGVHLSYGLVLLAPAVAAVAWRRRRGAMVVWAGVGGLAVTAAFLAAGFAWWEGLAATHDRYVDGIAASRPYGYSLLGNLAAVGFATGPAVAVGLANLRGRAVWVVIPTVVAVLAADVTGLSKGEVERIWLFLIPGLVVAASTLTGRPRAWLTLQVISALALAGALRTPW